MNQDVATVKKEKPQKTQIIGIRFPLEMAKAIKVEAVQRNMRINHLFQEIWEGYLKSKKGS